MKVEMQMAQAVEVVVALCNGKTCKGIPSLVVQLLRMITDEFLKDPGVLTPSSIGTLLTIQLFFCSSGHPNAASISDDFDTAIRRRDAYLEVQREAARLRASLEAKRLQEQKAAEQRRAEQISTLTTEIHNLRELLTHKQAQITTLQNERFVTKL